MNARIKELEAQCWEPKQYGPPWFNQDKFAELIIQECERVILAESATVKAGGDVDDAWKMGMDCSIDTIKQHFGVKS